MNCMIRYDTIRVRVGSGSCVVLDREPVVVSSRGPQRSGHCEKKDRALTAGDTDTPDIGENSYQVQDTQLRQLPGSSVAAYFQV